MSNRILVVDDEPQLRDLLARILQLEGYDTSTASSGKEALRSLEQNNAQVVITDVQMPEMSGVELTSIIKEKYPFTQIICLTAYGNIKDGVQAIKNGALDYLEKDDYRTKIIPLVAKAMQLAGKQSEIIALQSNKGSPVKEGFEKIIGSSKALLGAITLAQKVSRTDATVLLTGETGTGKEVMARAIHSASSRSDMPMITINCAALGKDILESELFGHMPGAFTGAVKEKKGLFQAAHGGTIFLDEIGEMDIELQAKILRVLEYGTFIKLGDTKEQKVNVRIIAATHRILQEEIRHGNFREDLYYRLATFEIRLPSLNERKEDIPALAQFFVIHAAERLSRPIEGMGEIFAKALQNHNWQGNIRELKNVIERAVILEDGETLGPNSLPYGFNNQSLAQGTETMREIEKAHIQKILDHTNGNKTKTAKILDIGLTTLYAKIKEYGL